MIAVAVKTNKENPAVNTVFGRSKWFALINDNEIELIKNEAEHGHEAVDNLIQKGVKTIICNHMAQKPYLKVTQNNIECFYSGDERITLNEILEKLKNNQLIKIDQSNQEKYIKSGDHHHHH